MFRGVEFRGVWREPLDVESRAVLRLQGSHGAAVSAEPVDDEGDGPANLAQQLGDEEIEVLGREIAVEDVDQQAQAAATLYDDVVLLSLNAHRSPSVPP